MVILDKLIDETFHKSNDQQLQDYFFLYNSLWIFNELFKLNMCITIIVISISRIEFIKIIRQQFFTRQFSLAQLHSHKSKFLAVMDTEEVKTPPAASKWVRYAQCKWHYTKVYINFHILLFLLSWSDPYLTQNTKIIQIKLNVGGKHFMTSRETLMRDANSMLARLVSDDCDLISDKVRTCLLG